MLAADKLGTMRLALIRPRAPACHTLMTRKSAERSALLSGNSATTHQFSNKYSTLFRYVFCSRKCPMQQTSGSPLPAQEASNDIIFACAHCSASFVVDAAAAGLTLDCQQCGKPTTVPTPALETAAADSIKVSDLQHQLKENESQRTEITGYINQLSIQLHRWQLRLQTLKERQQKLHGELAAICGPNTG